MSNPESCELIALIFSHKRDLTPQTWHDIFDRVTSSVQKAFRGPDGPAPRPHTRFLERNRVAELRIPCATSPSLRECKTLTDGVDMSTLPQSHHVDVILQPASLAARQRNVSGRRGLIVFDMDSTLIRQEVIDELARAVGRYGPVSAITEAAMRGDLDFEASLRARVRLLHGVPTTIWKTLRDDGRITFTPGARELVRVLKRDGWKSAVLSGGFTPLAEWVRESLGLDYAVANFLVERDGALTGELDEGRPVVDGAKKRELLLEIAEKEGVRREDCVAVGDGSNDLAMMEVAGLGVAFNAKPAVQTAAPTRLNSESLLDVVYVLGYTREEVDAALA